MTPPAAMIFAAGFGTRMGAMTEALPKPMLPLAGRPMIDHTVDMLRSAGIERIVANTHYLPALITPHLEDLGVEVLYENPILETGGGLRAALNKLGGEPVITVNPDVAWLGKNPLPALLDTWDSRTQALLMLVPISRAHATGENGDFSLEQGEIRRKGGFRYTGLQILDTSRMHEISEAVFSLNRYWDLLATSGPVHGLEYDGEWCDIGHPAGLETAERLLDK